MTDYYRRCSAPWADLWIAFLIWLLLMIGWVSLAWLIKFWWLLIAIFLLLTFLPKPCLAPCAIEVFRPYPYYTIWRA